MIKTIKNIRKLNNAKLIVLSNDPDVRKSFENHFNDYFKELHICSKSEEGLEIAQNENFDLAIIDTSIDGMNYYDLCVEFSKRFKSLPKIIISDSEDPEVIVNAINSDAYTFLSKPLRVQDIRLAVIMCLNQTKRGDKVEFQDGIYYDEYRDQFFKPGGSSIDFTKLEKGLLKLLISRKGDITDYDTIKDVVWKGKNMSIYTMRNIVNKIRQKTYYDIIKNHSNKGYVIDDVSSNN